MLYLQIHVIFLVLLLRKCLSYAMSTLFSSQRATCSFVLWPLKSSPIVPSIANQAHACPDLGIIVDLVNIRIRTCYRQQREHSVWIGTAFNFTA